MTLPAQYTESSIAAALARKTFAGALVVVDNTYAVGNECDLLVVTRNLMAIDVEIKISVADLKRDLVKDKWFHQDFGWYRPGQERPAPTPRLWPRGCHKHYYAIAAPIWREDLLEHCQKKSGVVTVQLREDGSLHHITVRRRVQSNRDAKPLSHSEVVNIARLASLRMWEAYRARDAAAAGARQARMTGAA